MRRFFMALMGKGSKIRLLVVAAGMLLVTGLLWYFVGHNEAPSASFTVTPSLGEAPLQVHLDGSASSDPGGRIASYTWDFGDGETGTGSALTHIYATPGTHVAKLTVTDDRGATHTTSQTITVTESTTAIFIPTVTEIEPPDGAIIWGTEAWIRWRSPVPAKGRVLWRKVGEGDFRGIEADEGGPLLARITSLEPGEKYEYVVENSAEGMVERSALRTFTVQSGLAFDPAIVEQSVKRDYDQTVTLTLRNKSHEKLVVAAKALAQFEDLPADIVGRGSVDEPAELAPGEMLPIRLAVTAADAMRETYDIPIEAAGAFARVRIRVTIPRFELSFRVVGEDRHTLSKTIEVRNDGDTLADFAVRIAPPNEDEVRLQPDAKHAYLPAGASIRFVATPVLYVEFDALMAELEAIASGQSRRHRLEFRVPPGLRLIGVRAGTQERTSSSDFYCTNKPKTCSEVSGPDGNGPAEGPEDDPLARWKPVPAAKGHDFVEVAQSKDGSPYELGSKGPDTFDCSGLISYSVKQSGCPDPADFAGKGSKGACDNMRQNPRLPWIPESDARPGDIVFIDYYGRRKDQEDSRKQDGHPDHCGFVSQTSNSKVTKIQHASGKGVNEGDPDTDATGYYVNGAPQAKYRQFIIGFKRPTCVPAPGPCAKEAACQ